MSKRIYTYYESIPTIDQREEFACEAVFRRTWKEQGWDAQILNKSHASFNPNTNKLLSKLHKESLGWPAELQNQLPKIKARLLRWAALEAAHGGWMADYDVVNIGFTPEIATDMESSGLFVTGPGKAYLFYASPELIKAALTRIINSPLIEGKELLPEHLILSCPYFSTNKLHHATKNPKRSENMEDVETNPPKIKSKGKITLKQPKALEKE